MGKCDGSCGDHKKIMSHEEFLKELKILGAPQDISLPVFEDLIDQGYDAGVWNTSVSAVDGPCNDRDGEQVELTNLIANLQHEAPFY